MTTSPGEVNAMKELLMRLNESAPADTIKEAKKAPVRDESVNRSSTMGSTNDMHDILTKFYNASGSATQQLVEEAQHSPELREALVTRKTNNGAIIGSWAVRSRLDESAISKGKKIYDVSNPETGEILFNGLVIFEAAHAIVRYLNKGFEPNHVKVEEIADLEEMFRRNRQDAAIFKVRYNRCIELNENAAAEVYDARYQKAKAHATIANDQIGTILKNIR